MLVRKEGFQVPLCIRGSGNISKSGKVCFKVFINQLIPISKYACICSEAEQIKNIKVTYTQTKQVNKRFWLYKSRIMNKNHNAEEKAIKNIVAQCKYKS